ncbi:ATP phosphoribosyltransferase regulatory subunit [Pilibacter termitis]|uniref:ATP phosphoribosyltransferase regulatory subunit n=1 Tax=Pilibacter termitis TaxID=263852 RepID=A0A1T4LP64_9ENTE|nr:ATP phosphoribosyltransferase regulatory subunit [Pilibacter termitis]SJZ56510.1 ATP phosphoribosyltransferase regulatory subunit [Pilibacter termitis]
MRKKQLPAGVQDKLFRRANGVYQLEAQMNELLRVRGFQRIETPTIEFAEVFEDEQNQDSLYRFFDHQGRMLTLRPDMTLPVGRVVASTKIDLPLKLLYSGKVFRYHDEMKGLQNEITQVGIEIIGFPSAKAEIEAILTAEYVLRKLEVPNFHLELGHASIFKKIIDELSLGEQKAEELKGLLLSKNITELFAFTQEFPSDLSKFIAEIPLLFGDVKNVIDKAKHLLPENHPIMEDLYEIEQLFLLFPSKTQEILRVDLGMIGVMDYYTGIMFAGFSEGIPENFLNGGRYDYLFKRFEMSSTTSVGWAMNLELVFDLLYKTQNNQRKNKILVHFETEEIAQVTDLVNAETELSLFANLSETLDYAKKWGYREVWYFKNGEFNKQEVETDE